MVGKFRYYQKGVYPYSGGRAYSSDYATEILDREHTRFRRMIPSDAFKNQKKFKAWYNGYFNTGSATGKTFMEQVPQKTFWDYLQKKHTHASMIVRGTIQHLRTNLKTKKFVKSYNRNKPKPYTPAQIFELQKQIQKYPKRINKDDYWKIRQEFNRKFDSNKQISAIQTKIRRLKKEK